MPMSCDFACMRTKWWRRGWRSWAPVRDLGCCVFFFFQAEDGIRGADVTGVQTCALPICTVAAPSPAARRPPPREVAVVVVQPGRVPQPYEFSGEVVSYRRIEVRARVDG